MTAGLRRVYEDAIPEPRAFWSLYLLLVATVSVALIWLAGFSEVPSSADGRTPFYYLLSAQAQVLGAILALVLTLSLVAAQLAARYWADRPAGLNSPRSIPRPGPTPSAPSL